MTSGILIDIRNTFDKEKRSYSKYASGILIDIRITFDKEKSSYIKYASGILIDIRNTFNKEKQEHVWCLQVFSSMFEIPSTKRNEDMYDVFRYSHRY